MIPFGLSEICVLFGLILEIEDMPTYLSSSRNHIISSYTTEGSTEDSCLLCQKDLAWQAYGETLSEKFLSILLLCSLEGETYVDHVLSYPRCLSHLSEVTFLYLPSSEDQFLFWRSEFMPWRLITDLDTNLRLLLSNFKCFPFFSLRLANAPLETTGYMPNGRCTLLVIGTYEISTMNPSKSGAFWFNCLFELTIYLHEAKKPVVTKTYWFYHSERWAFAIQWILFWSNSLSSRNFGTESDSLFFPVVDIDILTRQLLFVSNFVQLPL